MFKEIAKAVIPERPAFKLKQYYYGRNRADEKKLVLSNSEFKDRHKGQRCFILGNGPSMKYFDLGLLHDEITFTVNQIDRRADYSKLNTTYHFWADERFFKIDLEKGIDVELYEYMKRIRDANNNPIVFYKTPARNLIKTTKLDEWLNIKYFMEIRCEMPRNSASIDLDGILPMFSTVIQYEIVAAVYMGFTEIYLLGCDTTGILNQIEARINQGTVEYSYDVSKIEMERMKRMAMDSSMQMELMETVRILDDYEKLFDYCHVRGVKLINLTVPSLIESLPVMRLEDVL